MAVSKHRKKKQHPNHISNGKRRRLFPPAKKSDKFTRYISKDVLVVREQFIDECSGKQEDGTRDPQAAAEGRKRFWDLIKSPAYRMENETRENFKARQWLRNVAWKFYTTAFKTRYHNYILKVDGEYR